MGRYHPYEGGAWSVGGMLQQRYHAAAPADLRRMIAYCELRGRGGLAIYARMAETIRQDLSKLDISGTDLTKLHISDLKKPETLAA